MAPLESHAEFTPGRDAGSGGAAAGPGEVAGAGAGAGPARADAGVGVHVLPGRGAADGGRPGRHSRVRAAGAAVRGRAPVQFRRVRLAGAATWSSTSTTSTRPCPGRSSGTSSGWPRAWPWRDGTTGSPPRPAARSPCAAGEGYRTAMRGFADADLPGRLVRAPGHRAGHRPSSGPRSRRKGSRQAQKLLAKAHTSDSTKALGKLTTVVDGQRRIISDPPTDRPGRGGLRRRAGRRDLRADPHRAGQVPAHPAVRPAAPARAVHPGAGGPQGRRGRQRRHPRLDRADGRRRRRRAAVPAGQGGPAVGPGGVLPGAASTATRASGSSPGST